jgi:hypothetical protein
MLPGRRHVPILEDSVAREVCADFKVSRLDDTLGDDARRVPDRRVLEQRARDGVTGAQVADMCSMFRGYHQIHLQISGC